MIKRGDGTKQTYEQEEVVVFKSHHFLDDLSEVLLSEE